MELDLDSTGVVGLRWITAQALSLNISSTRKINCASTGVGVDGQEGRQDSLRWALRVSMQKRKSLEAPICTTPIPHICLSRILEDLGWETAGRNNCSPSGGKVTTEPLCADPASCWPNMRATKGAPRRLLLYARQWQASQVCFLGTWWNFMAGSI